MRTRCRWRALVTLLLGLYTGVRSQEGRVSGSCRYTIALNRTGEPIHITPARRISGGRPDGLDSAVVVLGRGFAAAGISEPALRVFWGAYLSMTGLGRRHVLAQEPGIAPERPAADPRYRDEDAGMRSGPSPRRGTARRRCRGPSAARSSYPHPQHGPKVR
jgi:hypothetical protein